MLPMFMLSSDRINVVSMVVISSSCHFFCEGTTNSASHIKIL